LKRIISILALFAAVLAAEVRAVPDIGRAFKSFASNVTERLGGRRDGAPRAVFAGGHGGPADLFRSKRHDAFNSAKGKLAVIVAGAKAGTGFLVREGGRVWLMTNAHVVRGEPLVRATLLDGSTLALGACEYAAGRDLARFAVTGPRPALEVRKGLPDVGERVTVLGNTDGRGVITEINGSIVGVGPTEIEVDAAFAIGNSGSPVIDRNGAVVAVASYLRDCRNDADWSKRNTRFNGIRRFALRLSGVRWERPAVAAR